MTNENDKLKYCWLDCDPGHDDMFAILLASYSSQIKIVGISTVFGNQPVNTTANNALKVLNLIGSLNESSLPFPVIRGCNKALFRTDTKNEENNIEKGLDKFTSIKFPPIPSGALDNFEQINSSPFHFTTQIYQHLKTAPEPVTIIAIGPLTNIALLLINHPDCVNYIERIVMMGGAIGMGNTETNAEFNIYKDPEAAHLVFESNIPIYMVPLEVTHNVVVTKSIFDKISCISDLSETLFSILKTFYDSFYATKDRFKDPVLHDPCAVAFITNPEIFEYNLMRVEIETNSSLTFGQTICDVCGNSSKRKNVYVCHNMDVEIFWQLITDAIHLASTKSPLSKKCFEKRNSLTNSIHQPLINLGINSIN